MKQVEALAEPTRPRPQNSRDLCGRGEGGMVTADGLEVCGLQCGGGEGRSKGPGGIRRVCRVGGTRLCRLDNCLLDFVRAHL